MRHNRSQTGSRRSHHALKITRLSLCPDCKAPILSHMVCMNCGKYKGRLVIDLTAKMAKREKKMKERGRSVEEETVKAK